MTVIDFPNRRSSVARQHDAWEAYRVAFIKAQQTLDLADGIAAAKAYARFHDLFVDKNPDGAA